MFLTYSELLNSLDSGAVTKITINNRRLNKANFETSILMPMQGDFRDEYRGEYNQMLLDKATGANGIIQEKYRPVLILQNNTGNKYSPTVIVAAISSKVDAKAKLPTHYILQAENGLELPSLVLLEQLRTIDKKRLGAYIGHLEEKHIRKINHALAVSVGLIEEVPENLIMCLCPACANNFYGTGSYYLRRVHPDRVEKNICTYCGQRPGFDYEVVKRRQ